MLGCAPPSAIPGVQAQLLKSEPRIAVYQLNACSGLEYAQGWRVSEILYENYPGKKTHDPG